MIYFGKKKKNHRESTVSLGRADETVSGTAFRGACEKFIKHTDNVKFEIQNAFVLQN